MKRATMAHEAPNLAEGSVLDWPSLYDHFRCASQGGMRYSSWTNSLLIFLDPHDVLPDSIYGGRVVGRRAAPLLSRLGSSGRSGSPSQSQSTTHRVSTSSRSAYSALRPSNPEGMPSGAR